MRAAARRHGAIRLTADDLFEFDQDHYGGIGAVDALARRAGVAEASRVLDVCAGLAGPARFLATRRGCHVVGVELHAGRAASAARLTRDVGLDARVAMLVFTDWVAHGRLADAERARLHEWMAATTLQSFEGYRALVGHAGFGSVEAEDLSPEWRMVLRARLERHRAERPAMIARFGAAWTNDYDRLFAFFVGLVDAGKLGGGRFSGTA